ncbi:hypothetical protein C0992_000526 [Termitomyces sp. T32_za158]|nr:hypothetical protein C0992_000526 [Termitomyces sp. T32_za158]
MDILVMRDHSLAKQNRPLLSQATEPTQKKSTQAKIKELPERDSRSMSLGKEGHLEPNRRSLTADPAPHKKQRLGTAQAASVPKVAEEDAHEWFLEHFDDYNEPGQSQPLSPRAQSPPARPAASASSHSRHSSKTHTPTPSAVPDAADALEQELEELLPDPPHVQVQPGKVEPRDADMDMDMDVDLVAELGRRDARCRYCQKRGCWYGS